MRFGRVVFLIRGLLMRFIGEGGFEDLDVGIHGWTCDGMVWRGGEAEVCLYFLAFTQK